MNVPFGLPKDSSLRTGDWRSPSPWRLRIHQGKRRQTETSGKPSCVNGLLSFRLTQRSPQSLTTKGNSLFIGSVTFCPLTFTSLSHPAFFLAYNMPLNYGNDMCCLPPLHLSSLQQPFHQSGSSTFPHISET